MAGVAQNVQVVSNSGESVVFEQDISASDLGFNLNTSEDTSLQELIDSELALRISNTESEKIIESVTDKLIETFPVKTVHQLHSSWNLILIKNLLKKKEQKVYETLFSFRFTSK